MKNFKYPVIFDATHSVQLPGGMGNQSDGQYEFVDTLATASTTVGIAAIFMETHENPDIAPSDGPNMWPINELKNLLEVLVRHDKIAKNLN